MLCHGQAIYVPADDLTDPAPATTFAHLDATTVLSRGIAELGIYPAVDPLDSTSRMLNASIIGDEHYAIARGVQQVLQVSHSHGYSSGSPCYRQTSASQVTLGVHQQTRRESCLGDHQIRLFASQGSTPSLCSYVGDDLVQRLHHGDCYISYRHSVQMEISSDSSLVKIFSLRTSCSNKGWGPSLGSGA